MSRMFKQLLKQFATGVPFIVIDDSKEKEHAAMVCLAEFADPEVINLMIKYARGIVSVAMTPLMATQAELPFQSTGIYSSIRNYTISIDADETTTGISAYERSFSIKKMASTGSSHGFKRPGHIFPLVSHPDGLYGNTSVVEATLDLAIISEKPGMTVICDMLDLQGDMADGIYAKSLANSLDISFVYVSDILKYRMIKDGLLASQKLIHLPVSDNSVVIYTYNLHHVCFYFGLKMSMKERAKEELEKSHRLIQAFFPYFDPYVLDIYVAETSWIEEFNRFAEGEHFAIMFDTDTAVRNFPLLMKNLVYQLILFDIMQNIYPLNDQVQPVFCGAHYEHSRR